MQTQINELIQAADSILITTHISPDPDALCSLLLMGTSLRHNFPDKEIIMSVEELTGGLNYLQSYDQIQTSDLAESLLKHKPQLVIIVDAMSYLRCSRGNPENIERARMSVSPKLIIIDHHEPEGRDEADVYINQGSPAAVQDVYEVCFSMLGLEKPEGYARTTLLGLYSDTGGFVYDNPRYRETYKLLIELLDAGESIEHIKNDLDQYSSESMIALGEIASNVRVEQDYTFSYLSDDFMKSWKSENKQFEDVHLAVGLFANHYLRNIEGRTWGFIIYPDIRAGDGCYGVSFRSVAGAKDVAAIANKLGGGGHKPAAGAKFKADNLERAIDIIKSAIDEK